jgi:hypothetical protein
MVQEQQFETNMMHIARLTDPPKSAGQDNLTITNIPNLVTDADLKTKLTKLVDDAKDKCAFAREWRNKRFAHHDLLLATQDDSATPLQAASKDSVKAALAALAAVLNAVELHYFKGGTVFDEVAVHNGANTLLYILGFGVKARSEMQAKIAVGKFENLGEPENI